MTEINWLRDWLIVSCDALISEHTCLRQSVYSIGKNFFEEQPHEQLRTAVILQVNNVPMLVPARIASDGP